MRFFALFFWQELGMSPVATNAVYACGPVGIAALAFVMDEADDAGDENGELRLRRERVKGLERAVVFAR